MNSNLKDNVWQLEPNLLPPLLDYSTLETQLSGHLDKFDEDGKAIPLDEKLSGKILNEKIIDDIFVSEKLSKFAKHQTFFVAGTMVHTDKGLVPIEKLKVGDRVLSKDDSGEGKLVYKPVIKTVTSREKRKIMSPINGIYCTNNHPFWTHVYEEDKPRWVAAEYVTYNDAVVSSLYPYVSPKGRLIEQHGLYEESVRDPYSIGGNYLVATGDPKIALCMNSAVSKKEGPGEIPMRVVDFRGDEPVEVLTNDRDHLFDSVSYADRLRSLDDMWWRGRSKFLDKNNRQHREEIKFYGQLVDDYIMPDWDNDINAKSTAYTDFVYNIKVADTHTYFVGDRGIWVHNTNCSSSLFTHQTWE